MIKQEPSAAPDQSARDLSLDINQSILCEAPAGSGKTELLTQRYLKLLAHVERPEQIWAITFTRKAVAEMRERVLSALEAAKQAKPEEPHKQLSWQLAKQVLIRDKEKNWQLSQYPSRLSIQTFDSLNTILTSSLPFTSNFGALFNREDNSQLLYQQAANDLLNDEHIDDNSQSALAIILSHLDNNWPKAEQLFSALLAIREQWLGVLPLSLGNQQDQYRDYFTDNLQHSIEHFLAQLNDQLSNEDMQHWFDIAISAYLRRYPEHSQQAFTQPNLPLHVEDLPVIKMMIEFCLTDSHTYRKSLTVRNGFPAASSSKDKATKQWLQQQKQQALDFIEHLKTKEPLLAILKQIQQLPDHHYNASQWRVLSAILTLLPYLYAKLTLVFKQHAQIDHSEVSIKAKQALGYDEAPSQLALALDYQLQHLLVDEFQDTSSSQIQLLNQLMQNWEVNDGKTIFCVGDAMQSIYSFRAANVGLFLKIKQNGFEQRPMTVSSLTANFRSQQKLVDWFNNNFSRIFPTENDAENAAVKFSPAISTKTSLEKEEVFQYLTKQDDNQLAAKHIVQTIQADSQSHPDRSYAVLVRSKAHLSEIIELCLIHQIDFQAVDLVPLKEIGLVNELTHLCKALLHQADRLSWWGLLTSPLLKLTPQQLLDIENLNKVANTQFLNR